MLECHRFTEEIIADAAYVAQQIYDAPCSSDASYSCSAPPAGAFPRDTALAFRLRCDGDADSAALYIHADGLSSGRGECGMQLEAERSLCEGGCLFTVHVGGDKLAALSDGGLFYYRYELRCGDDVLLLGGEDEHPTPMKDGAGERQLLLYRPERECLLPGGFIYHIFVDRFASSGKHTVRAGGTLATEWYTDKLQHASVRWVEL